MRESKKSAVETVPRIDSTRKLTEFVVQTRGKSIWDGISMGRQGASHAIPANYSHHIARLDGEDKVHAIGMKLSKNLDGSVSSYTASHTCIFFGVGIN